MGGLMDELISKRAATTIPVMPKEHRHYQTTNLDDAYEQGWNDLQKCIENLPPVQPKHGKWKPRYYDVGADVYVEWACSECGYVQQKRQGRW
jgi:hypothetical protein